MLITQKSTTFVFFFLKIGGVSWVKKASRAKLQQIDFVAHQISPYYADFQIAFSNRSGLTVNSSKINHYGVVLLTKN